jgi:molybdate transport system substrate-binding protein
MTAMKKVAALAAVVLAVASCGTRTAATGSTAPANRTITVFAASSLTGLFTDLAKQYESMHPGLTIKLSFGSSTTLAQQISEGAPANVFASASTKAMAAAGTRIVDAKNYVKNEVVVAVPASVTWDYAGGAYMLNHATHWIQCAHEAPCGTAADKAVAAYGVKTKPVSLEPDVKSVVAKLLAGEADAGIIYWTDAKAAGGKLNYGEFSATLIAGSAEQQAAVSTQYMVGQVDAGNADAAAFVDFIRGGYALAKAADLGFTVPQ